jgi:hypothetical protein
MIKSKCRNKFRNLLYENGVDILIEAIPHVLMDSPACARWTNQRVKAKSKHRR